MFAILAGTKSASSELSHCTRNMSWPSDSVAPMMVSGLRPRSNPRSSGLLFGDKLPRASADVDGEESVFFFFWGLFCFNDCSYWAIKVGQSRFSTGSHVLSDLKILFNFLSVLFFYLNFFPYSENPCHLRRYWILPSIIRLLTTFSTTNASLIFGAFVVFLLFLFDIFFECYLNSIN